MALFPAGLRPFRADDGADHQTRSQFRARLQHARLREGRKPAIRIPQEPSPYLKKYAELQPGQPNPQDSLGEVSRYAGDDRGSIEHYKAALKVSPAFITSQTGPR